MYKINYFDKRGQFKRSRIVDRIDMKEVKKHEKANGKYSVIIYLCNDQGNSYSGYKKQVYPINYANELIKEVIK